MKILFATSNKIKIYNAKKTLKNLEINIKGIIMEFPKSNFEDPKEIALEKAKLAFLKYKKPVIVEDSGFFINALKGFPMTHIKFSLKTIGIKNILKMLESTKDRSAEWRMTLAYVSSKNKYKTFTFIEKGQITKDIRPIKREIMSDYWRIYIPKMIKNNKLALSEMSNKDLKKWEEYYHTHNHFVMFARNLKK